MSASGFKVVKRHRQLNQNLGMVARSPVINTDRSTLIRKCPSTPTAPPQRGFPLSFCPQRASFCGGSMKRFQPPQNLCDVSVESFSSLSLNFSAPLTPIGSAWGVWAALAFASAAGLWSEKTKVGRELSGALVSTLIGLVLSNIGIISSEAPQYAVVNKFLLPLAIPLLLYSADLRRVIRDTGRLLVVFSIGSCATVIGTLTAFKLFPLRSMGEDAWKVASALCARHIGGAVNYVGVGEAVGLGASAATAGLAADNLLCAVYFAVLYYLARDIPPEKGEEGGTGGSGGSLRDAEIKVLEGCTGLALSACLCFAGVWLANVIGLRGASIPIITMISVLLATVAPNLLSPLVQSSEGLATILMQVFFASIGASGSLKAVLSQAPLLFSFSFVQIAVHLSLLLGIGKLFGIEKKDILLASNANVGGPTTAAGMCSVKDWRQSLVPSLLIGTFGYAVATFLSIGLGYGVLRKI